MANIPGYIKEQVEKDVQIVINNLKRSFSYHAIIVYGDIQKQLAQVADLMGVEKCFL